MEQPTLERTTKQTMAAYLTQRMNRMGQGPAAAKLGHLGRKFVPSGLRPVAKLTATKAIATVHRKRALKLLEEDGLSHLHLGCGATRLPGWLNINLFGTNADVFLDLREQMPFPDSSVSAIFHEHLLEHLPYMAALRFTQECARIVRPGGVLRVGVPDFRRYCESYLSDQGLIEEMRPNRPTRLLAFTEVFYEHGHCSMWDEETLQLLMIEAGFSSVERSAFGVSALGPIDSTSREIESLYVEAIK